MSSLNTPRQGENLQKREMSHSNLPYLAITLAVCLLLSLGLASCSRGTSEPLMKGVNFNQWQQTLAENRANILVVDAWATWCETCVDKFPKMVDLAKRYKKHDVQFVSLNLDDRNSPEDLAAAESFLRRMDADFPHFFMDENMMEAFDLLGFLSLPVVLIYGDDGQERYRLSGDNPNQQYTDEDVVAAIENLLSERGRLNNKG